MNNSGVPLLAILALFVMTSCVHQSQVVPSTGHIDSQSTPQLVIPSTATDIPKPLKSSTFLPPPAPKPKEQTYSVVVNEVPVKEILFALARESNLNIDIHPSIQGRVTLNAVDQTLPAILERLAKQVDLTYKVENNVLSITPDHPVLRIYKIDYVNMSRDTNSSIGAAAEIATAGRAAAAGAQSGGAAGSAGGLSANGSRTQVSSESRNRFWETLIQNIKDLLAETDKEVLITRESAPLQSASNFVASASADATTAVVADARQASMDRDEARKEYKTLFAANVIANKEAGIISVRGTNKQHEKVQEFLDKVLNSSSKQVLIEATIVEVELKDKFQAGIDWSRLGNGLTFRQTLQPTVTDPLAPNSLSSFTAGYVYTGSGILADLSASIRLLQEFGDTKVLSSPKLMVLNNQTAVLKVVDNLVYFTIEAQVTQNQTNSNTVFTTTPQTVPVGVVMSVTPQVSDNSSVMLNVRPTVSRFITDVQDPNPNLVVGGEQITSRIPVIQVREMESLLRVTSGDTTVLGGLMQDDIKDNDDRVPGLSKLPLIGRAFKAKAALNKKSELIIFLRPTIINKASLESDELETYKQYLPSPQLQQSLDEPAY
jgi:MSHA biogenesis protein MshL